MSHPAPQAVLVDMDGTIVDTEGVWHQSESATMLRLGSVWEPDDKEFSLGGPLDKVAGRMRDKSLSHLSTEQIGTMLLDEVERQLLDHPLAFTAGTEALLDGLVAARIPMALVSASPRRLMNLVLSRLGADHFATTVAGDEVTASKPDPTPYLTAADHLGVDIRRCVILEDSPTGVAAGLASGGVVVAIPHLVPVAAGPRLVVVASLTDVTPAHLAQWLATA